MSREAMRPPARHVTTLVYALRDGALAMIHRGKQPNQGLWSPPGGKIEPGESPMACALRELAEETGLHADRATLRAVVSEWDPARDEVWLMFAFLTGPTHGQIAGDGREGRVAWVPLAEVAVLPMPPADPHILRAVLDPLPGVAFLDVRMEDGRLVDIAVARDR